MNQSGEASWYTTGVNTADACTNFVNGIVSWRTISFGVDEYILRGIVHKSLVNFSDMGELSEKDSKSFCSALADP